MFKPDEPRDTKGRWIAVGRGELERVIHAAVDARAHDIARANGHDEAKAQQIQAHLRRQALAKIQVAPKYHIKISERHDHRGRAAMNIAVQVPGQKKARVIDIPHMKAGGNLEQKDRVIEEPKPEQVDRPDQHGEAEGTGTIAHRMKQAVGGTPQPVTGENRYARENVNRQAEFRKGVQRAAHAVAQQKRKRVGAGAETAPAEREARQMEAAGAAKRVPAQSAKAAAQLIRDQGGAKEARKGAKGAVKKALDTEFGTKPALAPDAVELEMKQGQIHVDQWFAGAFGGIGKGKGLGKLGGHKVFIKLDSGAYQGALRPGVPRGRPDGPAERGAALVGNLMGVDGGKDGRMPHVILLPNIDGKGPGMAKEYVEGNAQRGGPSSDYKREHMWMVLDLAIANLDRHGGNHIEALNGRDYFPMDHGLSFPDDSTHQGLSRGLHRMFGKPFMPREREALQKLVDNQGNLTQSLRDSGLSERQIESMWGRVHGALAAGRYPNNEGEAAQWGKPGRLAAGDGHVVPSPSAVVRSAKQQVNARARNEIRKELDKARAMADGPGKVAEFERLRAEIVDGEARAAGAGDAHQVGRWQNFMRNVDAEVSAAKAAAQVQPRDVAASFANKNVPAYPPPGNNAEARAIVKKMGYAAENRGDIAKLDDLIAHAADKQATAKAGGMRVRARAWDALNADLREMRARVNEDRRAGGGGPIGPKLVLPDGWVEHVRDRFRELARIHKNDRTLLHQLLREAERREGDLHERKPAGWGPAAAKWQDVINDIKARLGDQLAARRRNAA